MKKLKSEIRELTCKCGKVFTRRVPIVDTHNRYCSVKCKHHDIGTYKLSEERKEKLRETMKGINNPNYGRKWSEDKKREASIRTKESYVTHPEYREYAARANKGVKFSEERIKRMFENRVFIGTPHTDESKRLIGIKSKAKFTPEFLQKHRSVMEARGHWIPIENKSDFEIYYKESNWKFGMIEYLNEEELSKLKQYGMFNRESNTKGYVRDHVFSRKWGFLLKIPPCILRHPVNLKFISHSDNIKKGFKDRWCEINMIQYIEDRFKELIYKIINYDKEWCEQLECIEAISSLGLI